ncbi:probable G-protein coupled receptor Mth-like 4 [Pieris brassicae]|uniref:probable G-protein coupled receptor Mth-like 4 n=1 Tax=Pieris brassicae TaxID=7116 RepID=UPI001E660ABA|nr:probable G-protein coupled receptor Mth-like 4 [Pieris brassicae]
MFRILCVLAYFNLVVSDPLNTYCCLEEDGILSENEALCVNPVNEVKKAIRFNCKNTVRLFQKKFNFTVNDNESATIYMGDKPFLQGAGSFCAANETTNNTLKLLLLCTIEEKETNLVLSYCMIVSAIFLALTAILYCALPILRDLQGKSIICFCVSLALGLIILAIMNLVKYSDMNLCAARGFLTYYFMVSSFFWMNSISIQILFRIKRPSVPDYGWRTFSWYALYAFGTPALITIAMSIVNFHPGKHQKPGIGLNTCWFYDKRQQWYYMYSVLSILMAINIAIFCYLSVYLWRQTFLSTHVKELRYKFGMTLKMFIIMGLPWIFEMISTFFEAHIIWTVLDIFNLMQGPFMFIVLVVLRKRVLKALYKSGCLDCVSGLVERYLAIAEDDEEIVQHTIDVPLDDKKHNNI